MSSLSFETLQEILLKKQLHDKSNNDSEQPSNHLDFDALWKHPALFQRTSRIDATLYRCPVSTPLWTIIPWKSIPFPVQQQLQHLKPTDENTIVSVPSHYLSTGENVTMTANLTSKLTEYTRGLAGRARPFLPGGMEKNNTRQDDSSSEEQLAIQQSRRVLQQSTKQSWKEGILLTAPRNVDFKVGLTWTDIYGDDEGMNGNHEDKTSLQHAPPKSVTKQQPFSTSTPQTVQAPTLFSTGFLDGIAEDDSLFGNSSSSEEEEEEDEHEHETIGKETIQTKTGNFSNSVLPVLKEQGQNDTAPPTLAAVEQSVDDLLLELTDEPVTDRQNIRKDINPLEIAEKQAALRTNTTRKSWATTDLLDIPDWDTYLPQPAIKYPFVLDTFQQQAIARLERNEAVFVAAHTSAGKTVVAEYAVALAMQRATRCVYTSPIKALSNQKFRDFAQKFGAERVGLVTGDLQVNVDDSTVLIMTTEILRSMLYRGADLIRDIEFVVFDEVHYVNDSERGVVWEEVIIMLPAQVNLIFLSATTPNTLEFSDWIGRTKRRMVHVVKTDYRPVPLSHFLWAGNKLHLVLHGKGGFLDGGYADATNALQPQKKKADGKVKPQPPKTGSKVMAWQAQGTKTHWISLIRFLDREFLTPTVIFSFSKKKCEEIADMLRSLDLNTQAERGAVQGFTLQAIARLSSADAKLPQVLAISEMATRGIGVHHGGLLPILKELVEILFSRNLIKVLLATETFAMGVNMPAKSVVFNSVRKHDGTQFRQLEPGEYTQMAGRAGRRGLDDIGTVIICCFGETPPPQTMLRSMLTGKSTLLKSQFRLTYNMILNLLRVEDMSVESMIKRSFSEFATQRALTAKEYPQLLERGTKALTKLESQLSEELRLGAEDLEDYFSVCHSVLSASKEVLSFLFETDSSSFNDLLQAGRIILVSAARQYGAVRAPAIVLKLPTTVSATSLTGPKTSTTNLVCLILLPSSYVESQHKKEGIKKLPAGHIGYIGSYKQRFYSIREIELGQILAVSTTKQKIDVKVLLKEDSATSSHPLPNDNFFPPVARHDPFSGMKALGRNSGGAVKLTKEDETMEHVISQLLLAEQSELDPSGLPTVDLQSYVKRGNDVIYFRQACDRIQDLHSLMRTFQSHRHPNLEKYYKEIERRETLRERVQLLEHTLSNESLSLFPDFIQRKAVLRELGYISENETVTIKGRVACEVNTCEELIVSEMIFDGLLNNMAPEEIVACLSALVFQEKQNEDYNDNTALPTRLIECCEKMKEIAVQLGQVQKENGLAIDPSDYCDRVLKFGLVHVVYEWACGVSFASICVLTEVQEGSIVRSITRLDELCREVRNCARVIGNPTLYRKMEAAGETIKRDIVFASSLYVS